MSSLPLTSEQVFPAAAPAAILRLALGLGAVAPAALSGAEAQAITDPVPIAAMPPSRSDPCLDATIGDAARWRRGTIHRFAGSGAPGYAGDDGPAREARLHGPAGLAVDREGRVLIADLRNHAIRRVDARTGVITTVAGTGQQGFSGDGGPAVLGRLNGPEGVAVDLEGNLFIADSGNNRIRSVAADTGTISTLAGNGERGIDSAGGRATAAQLNHPAGVGVDATGDVYLNDYANDLIRRVDPSGVITTVAGNGVAGYSGDGGPAAAACINDVYGLAVDRAGDLFFVDSLNFRIRRIERRTGCIHTVLGTGQPGPVIEFAPATHAQLGGVRHAKGTIGSNVAHGVDVDQDGNVFVADSGVHRIRMLHRATAQWFTIAGNGESGMAADGAVALETPLETHGVRVGPDGTIYSVDFVHHVVLAIRVPAAGGPQR